jgi:hypothetical protein
MVMIKSEIFTILTNTLGGVRAAISDKFGDLNKKPGVLMDLESVLTKLRGSTLFHDSYVSKDFMHFGTSDNLELGLQGGYIDSPHDDAMTFPEYDGSLAWNPTYGAPCAGVWFSTDYGGWKWYKSDSESDTEYPVDSQGQRLPLWSSGRVISLLTDANVLPNSSISFKLSAEELSGLKIIQYAVDSNNSRVMVNDKYVMQIDVDIYYDPNLVQSRSVVNDIASWSELISTPTNTLTRIANFQVIEDGDYFTFVVNIPSDVVWNANTWLHLFVYWGSSDSG